jgi:hypothetical protein
LIENTGIDDSIPVADRGRMGNKYGDFKV